jgi:hypothetical protein
MNVSKRRWDYSLTGRRFSLAVRVCAVHIIVTRPTGQKFKRRQRAVDSGRREDDRCRIKGSEYFNVSGQQVESTQRYAWSAVCGQHSQELHDGTHIL